MKRIIGILLGVILLVGLCIASLLPKGPGVNLVYSKCQMCHSLDYVTESKGITSKQWKAIVEEMEGYGLQITSEEKRKIIEYLSDYMGPAPKKVLHEAKMPEISGKKLFLDNCAGCHQNNGEGISEAFPPLAGNTMLFKDDYPVYVILFGLTGPIKVGNETIDDTMPPFYHLSDEEIASIVNYVRKAWGNDKFFKKSITPQDVAKYRKKELSDKDVYKLRNKLSKK